MYESRSHESPLSAVFASGFLFTAIWWMIGMVG